MNPSDRKQKVVEITTQKYVSTFQPKRHTSSFLTHVVPVNKTEKGIVVFPNGGL